MLVLVLSGALLGAPAAATPPAAHPLGIAQPTENCLPVGGGVACVFTYTGAEQSFTVPPSNHPGQSTFLIITAIGAPGAAGEPASPAGGLPAYVQGNLWFPAGTTLYIEVGGAPTTTGTTPSGGRCDPDVACIGGFNGGGTGDYGSGGGGGGASDVRTIPRAQRGSLASRVIVAAGGGGSGAGVGILCQDGVEDGPPGGAGGAAGTAGSPGAACRGFVGGGGGGAGTQSVGGAGGAGSGPGGTTGQPGGFGQGGTSFETQGGGGGGGWYGGGAGGDFLDFDAGEVAASGGGGGGSSLVPTGGIAVVADPTDVPWVEIFHFTGGAGLGPPPDPCAAPPAGAIIGTDDHDVLVGTHGADLIVAKGGNDLIRSKGGDDQVCGGPGNDKILAGTGDDLISGGEGRDRLVGSTGDDILAGGAGSDLTNGGADDDTLIGDLPGKTPTWLPPTADPEPNRDTCIGAAGTDTALLCEHTIGAEAGGLAGLHRPRPAALVAGATPAAASADDPANLRRADPAGSRPGRRSAPADGGGGLGDWGQPTGRACKPLKAQETILAGAIRMIGSSNPS